MSTDKRCTSLIGKGNWSCVFVTEISTHSSWTEGRHLRSCTSKKQSHSQCHGNPQAHWWEQNAVALTLSLQQRALRLHTVPTGPLQPWGIRLSRASRLEKLTFTPKSTNQAKAPLKFGPDCPVRPISIKRPAKDDPQVKLLIKRFREHRDLQATCGEQRKAQSTTDEEGSDPEIHIVSPENAERILGYHSDQPNGKLYTRLLNGPNTKPT